LCQKITAADIKKDSKTAQAVLMEIRKIYQREIGMDIGLQDVKTHRTIF
jgi:hypothetical protein